MPFNLTGQQNERLTNIMCIAYPTMEALSAMLRFKLEKNIEEFNGGNVRTKIADIIERAKAENWLVVLLDGCIQGNPENVQLQEIVKSINNEIINIELSELYSNPQYALFRPLIEQLQKLLSTQRIHPLIFFAFLSIIHKIHEEDALGHPAPNIIDSIINEQAMPEDWKFGELYKKNKSFFDKILNDFKTSIKFNLEPTVFQIPFVLAIMNRSEAEELGSGSLLENYSQQIKNDFDDIQSFFDKSGFNNWIEHYGENSEDWLPFLTAEGGETVKQIIEDILQSIAQSDITYTPVFINVQTLNSEENRPIRGF